jgi:hypothetical protein
MSSNLITPASLSSVVRWRRALSRYLPLCLLGLGLSVSANESRIITFDAPGAGTSSGQGTGCFAYTDCSVIINDWGAITGYYLDASNVFHGYVRTPEGKFTSFEAPGSDTNAGDFNGTLPNGINDAGAITGVYYDASNEGHGFLRSPEGKFTTFDVTGGSIGTTTPIALNLESAIVGFYLDQAGVFEGFLRHPDGKFETWIGPGACNASPSTGCFGTGAFSINFIGTIAGGFEDNSGNFVGHALLRSPQGKFKAFEAPGAGTGSYEGTGCPGCSVPLNQFGAIAGYYFDANDVVHSYLRSPDGKITTFDALGGGSEGFGCYADCSISLNDWGVITGYYLDADNVFHGYVRTPEGKFTSFEAPGADTNAGDFNGTFPVSINDAGAISGYYIDAYGVSHGFLRLPGSSHDD